MAKEKEALPYKAPQHVAIIMDGMGDGPYRAAYHAWQVTGLVPKIYVGSSRPVSNLASNT